VRLFIDTGAFVARHRLSDAHHARAQAGWTELRRKKRRLFTSNLVLLEAANLLADLRGGKWSAEKMLGWLSSAEMSVLHSEREVELSAAELMARYADQHIGPVDCVSFIMMQRHGIKKCFGFDRHFKVAGFELWPEQQ
jgi:uncharacterized protein